MRTVRTAALAAAATLLVGSAVSMPQPATAEEPSQGKLLLMLDASGSMKAKDPSGLTKIAAAKKALTGVVQALPDDAQVGLRVYGATQAGGKPTKAACADTQLVHPIGPIDRGGLSRAVNGFQAKGETPIAYSLTQAMGDLGSSGKRNIVLVSDGEESCVPDPCPTVRKLVGSGIDLQIDTVGFGVGSKARKQLQCIAAAGHGSYFDAKDSDALTTSLTKLSQRALRSFTITGTPVQATSAAEEAPILEPGQYKDSFALGEAVRYYQLHRSAGSTARLSVTARPPADPDIYSSERLDVLVTTPEGKRCDGENAVRFDPGKRSEAVVSHLRIPGPEDEADLEACHSAETLLVSVARPVGVKQPVPVEVLYIEEPPVTDPASLPEPIAPDAVTPLLAPASGQGVPATGGGSFSDALTLEPGTYRDTILPAEQVFYRVKLDFGQRAALTVDAPAPGEKLELGRMSYTGFALDVFGPDRAELSRTGGEPANSGSLGPSGTPLLLGEFTPEIRYANRTSTGSGSYSYVKLREASIAGYYYFALGRTAEKAGEDSSAPVNVRVRLSVTGEPGGQPTYADGAAPGLTATPTTPSGSPSATAAPSPSSGGSAAATKPAVATDGGLAPFLWVGVAVAVVLGAAGALFAARRKRLGHL